MQDRYRAGMGVNQRAQIRMSDDEVAAFVRASRTATLATNGPNGTPHLVAMWFAVLDGEIWFETKVKSQKVVNLRRDDRVTCLIEDGLTYDVLRGVSIEGRAVVSSDSADALRVGISVWERYYGPYTEDQRPTVEAMMNKRVVVRVVPERVRSWDHRKLGIPPMPISGSTARVAE
jgi:PPOX class probable F420-dependent enzyme